MTSAIALSAALADPVCPSRIPDRQIGFLNITCTGLTFINLISRYRDVSIDQKRDLAGATTPA